MKNRFMTGSDFSEGEVYARGFWPLFDMPLDACERISSGASRRYEYIDWAENGLTGTVRVSCDQFATFRDLQ